MLGDDEQSPLERKLAEDALLRDVEPIWDALYSAVQETCQKLTEGDRENQCRASLNDHNSRFKVIATAKERSLDIRLDRDEKKVFARISPTFDRTESIVGAPVLYRIVPCLRLKSLCFADGRSNDISAKEVAERDIAVRLLGIPLPSAR